jgi:hypothetical protein
MRNVISMYFTSKNNQTLFTGGKMRFVVKKQAQITCFVAATLCKSSFDKMRDTCV